MNLYIADRNAEVLYSTSDNLPNNAAIISDSIEDSVESGVKTVTIKLNATEDVRKNAIVGNYIMLGGGKSEYALFTIMEARYDASDRSIEIYGEDAGLDLLNKSVGEWKPSSSQTIVSAIKSILTYSESTGLYDGWKVEFGISTTATKGASEFDYTGDNTALERLLSVLGIFDSEMFFSYEIDGLKWISRTINIVKRRGSSKEPKELRLGVDIDNIEENISIMNLATAFKLYGKNSNGGKAALSSLTGYSTYSDMIIEPEDTSVFTGKRKHRYKVTGNEVRCLDGMERWKSRLDTDGKILKIRETEYESAKYCISYAIKELEKVVDEEEEYNVSFANVPDIAVGDTIRIVDEEDRLYLEARVMGWKKSETAQSFEATIGNYVRLESSKAASVVGRDGISVREVFWQYATVDEGITVIPESQWSTVPPDEYDPSKWYYRRIVSVFDDVVGTIVTGTSERFIDWESAHAAAAHAEETAQSVVDRADSGEFDGETGPQGEPGSDGKSAYQSAIDGGMPQTITEEQFNRYLINIASAYVINLAAGTIDAGLIKTGTLDADRINTGDITTTVVESQALNTKVATIADGKIEQATIKDAQIESINGNKIIDGSIVAAALSQAAVTTLSGNKVYYQATAPTGTNHKSGDTWYKTVIADSDTDKKVLHIWDTDEQEWVPSDFDAKLLRANSITAQEIAANSITAAKVNLEDLMANLIRIGSASGSRFVVDGDCLRAFDDDDEMYFELSADGISYGKYSVVTEKYVYDSVSSVGNTVNGTAVYSDGTHDVYLDYDGYYYLDSTGARVIVDESSLVKDGDNPVVEYVGGISEALDEMREGMKDVEQSINDKSLISRGYAAIVEDGLQLGETEGDYAVDIKDTGIELIVNGSPAALITSIGGSNNQSLLIVYESHISNMHMKSANGTGSLTWVAESDGSVSLKVVD